MTSTRKRGAASVATFAALGLALAACSGGGSGDDSKGEGVPESGYVGAMDDFEVGTTFVATEPVEFSILYRDHPNYPLKEDWRFLTALEENQKVTFDIVSAPLSDWDQRKGLLIGAGDAPEIITVTYPGQERQFIAGGAILPVSDYLEYMPNFRDKVERWGLQEDIDKLLVQEDGKYYLLPGVRESVRPQYTYAVRTDVWDELGLSYAPETFDDFRADLEKVKAAHPDVWPLTDRWSTNGPLEATLSFAAPNFGTAAGWGYGEGVWWDEDAGEFVYTGATDEYRSLIEYYAGLVADGLLDPEAITQDDDQAQQKLLGPGARHRRERPGDPALPRHVRRARQRGRRAPHPGAGRAGGRQPRPGWSPRQRSDDLVRGRRLGALRGDAAARRLAVLLRRGSRVRQVGHRGRDVHP